MVKRRGDFVLTIDSDDESSAKGRGAAAAAGVSKGRVGKKGRKNGGDAVAARAAAAAAAEQSKAAEEGWSSDSSVDSVGVDDEQDGFSFTPFEFMGVGVPRGAAAASAGASNSAANASRAKKSSSDGSAASGSSAANGSAGGKKKSERALSTKAKKEAQKFAANVQDPAAQQLAPSEQFERPAGGSSNAGSELKWKPLGLPSALHRAVVEVGWKNPTLIQAQAIPAALQGRDLSASAVTGSGKTGAFVLPMLAKLVNESSGRRLAATKGLIITPTRELATQALESVRKLGRHTDISATLVTGGLSQSLQIAALRGRPDIVVATPGRLIDLLLNASGVGLDDVEMVVLDEADRLLQEGFASALRTILQATPKTRQTLLFSATMTEDTKALATAALNKPVRISVDPVYELAARLTQEFIRLPTARSVGEHDDAEGNDAASIRRREDVMWRAPSLFAVITRSFSSRVLVFARSKPVVHRLKLSADAAGLSAAELHGSMPQSERQDALRAFKNGAVDILFASDVAARGLDISGIQTVINYDLPSTLTNYVHRVGRTARAGALGRAVSLVGTPDLPLWRLILTRSGEGRDMRQRVVSEKAVLAWRERLEDWEMDIQDAIAAEKEERLFQQAEMETRKAENMLKHADEIASRPPKTWFQTAAEKAAESTAARKVALGLLDDDDEGADGAGADEDEDEVMEDASSGKGGKKAKGRFDEESKTSVKKRNVGKKREMDDAEAAMAFKVREMKRAKKRVRHRMDMDGENAAAVAATMTLPKMRQENRDRVQGFSTPGASHITRASRQAVSKGWASAGLTTGMSEKPRLAPSKRGRANKNQAFRSKKRYKRRG